MRLRIASILCAFLGIASLAGAQVLYGSLTGNVTDPTGAAVPNVKVEGLNTATGVASETKTDERGAYLFSNLPLGTYRITVSAPSFKTMIQDNVRVNPNDVRRADFQLQITQIAESVEVS